MDLLTEFLRRLRMLFIGRQLDPDLEEEMRLHLDLRHSNRSTPACPAEEARRAAQRSFGNPTLIKEKSHHDLGMGLARKLPPGRRLRHALPAAQSRAHRSSPCSRSPSASAPTPPSSASSTPSCSAIFPSIDPRSLSCSVTAIDSGISDGLGRHRSLLLSLLSRSAEK